MRRVLGRERSAPSRSPVSSRRSIREADLAHKEVRYGPERVRSSAQRECETTLIARGWTASRLGLDASTVFGSPSPLDETLQRRDRPCGPADLRAYPGRLRVLDAAVRDQRMGQPSFREGGDAEQLDSGWPLIAARQHAR